LAGASGGRLEFLVSRRTVEILYMRRHTSDAAPSVQPHGRNLITLVANVRSYSPYLINLFTPAEDTRDATPTADAPTAGRCLPTRFSIAHTQHPVPQHRCRWPATRRLRRTGLTP